MRHRKDIPQFLQCQTRFRLNAGTTLSREEKLTLRFSNGNTWRRSHSKSKFGCMPCKGARVKCCETHPTCGRCAKRSTRCVYTTDGGLQDQAVVCSLASTVDKPAPSLVRQQYQETHATVMPIYKLPGSKPGGPEQLLKHFVSHTCSNLILGQLSSTYRNYIVPFAKCQPSLWHAILAISSRHLISLQPSVPHFRMAYYHHSQHSASSLGEVLQQPPNAEIGVLGHCTIFLLNIIAFADSWPCENQSWVFRDQEEDIDRAFSWIHLQASHQKTLRVYDNFLDDSKLYRTIFSDDAPRRDVRNRIAPCSVKISPSFARLCHIDSATTSDTNKYYHALCALQHVFELDKSTFQAQSFGTYMAFLVDMKEDFLGLLRGKDERALLIFVYWLCELCHLELWWMVERARNECRAICSFLQATAVEDVRRLLKYPSTVVEIGFERKF